jgi:hypothetical protein
MWKPRPYDPDSATKAVELGRPFGAASEPFDGDFDALVCAVLAGLGSADWDGVEEHWNLHRYATLLRHWSREGPPVYIAAASYLGLRKPTAPPPLEGDAVLELLRAFPGGEAATRRS